MLIRKGTLIKLSGTFTKDQEQKLFLGFIYLFISLANIELEFIHLDSIITNTSLTDTAGFGLLTYLGTDFRD